MKDPIDELMDEHRVIERVLGALEAAARKEVPLAFYERAVDFIANYADGRHHAKEEERLFPLLERKGIPREGGPIGVMCAEHQVGRGHVARMRAFLAAGDRQGLRRESLAYAALLRDHILKEDHVLFPMGRECLTAPEVDRMRSAFAEVSTSKDYERVADELVAEAS
jgi:hemerythrin-like domain-containing protein